MFHIRVLNIFVFITLQLVHHFTLNAKTIYCYAIKIIKNEKLYEYNVSYDMFRFFTNHLQGASCTSKTNSIGVILVLFESVCCYRVLTVWQYIVVAFDVNWCTHCCIIKKQKKCMLSTSLCRHFLNNSVIFGIEILFVKILGARSVTWSKFHTEDRTKFCLPGRLGDRNLFTPALVTSLLVLRYTVEKRRNFRRFVSRHLTVTLETAVQSSSCPVVPVFVLENRHATRYSSFNLEIGPFEPKAQKLV